MLLDIFKQNAFATTTLTAAIKDMEFKPSYLTQLGIFDPTPIRGYTFAVEGTANSLKLIETSPLGAPPKDRTPDARNMRDFRTVRLAERFKLNMVELSGIREFGSEEQLKQVAQEVAMRFTQIREDMELTREFHMLGAIQGILLDADGTTALYNYWDEFGLSAPTNFSLALNTTSTNVRTKLHELTRAQARASKGAIGPGVKWHALAGDEFFDKLVDHENVRASYLNYQAAAELRQNKAFGSFEYGGVMFHNYRGTDDNSTVAVDNDKAILFPVGARDVFKEVLSPAEFDPWVNTLGQREYAFTIPDLERGAFVHGELYSYPLYMCQRPQVLRTLTA
jgi:hypothetical protein